MARSMLAPSRARSAPAASATASAEGAASVPPNAGAVPLPIMLGALLVVLIASAIIVTNIVVSSPSPSAPAPLAAASPSPAPAAANVVPTPVPLVAPAALPLTVTATLGATGAASPAFAQPQEAVRGPDGLIYVADTGNHRIAVLDAHGKLVRTITRGASGPLQSPYAVAFAPNGHLYVLDSDAGQVLAYAPGPTAADAPLQASASSIPLVHARDMAINAAGQILVADPASNSVVTLSSDLALQQQQSNRGADGSDLYEQPDAIAAGPKGTVFVVDSQNNQVKEFSGGWHLLRSWPAVASDTLHAPHILPLAGGRLLVSDPADSKLLLFDPTSSTPQAFLVPPRAGLAAQPLGLAHGPDATILVTNNGTGQVLQVRLPGAR
jgi:hypothetical protein